MKIHFIALGGSVMHDLAIMLKKAGHEITGSDDVIREPSRSRLKAHGLLPNNEGWSTSRISANLDAVILGMHAREDNPELEYALDLGLPVYSFPEFVYRHAKEKKRVVIAGSHGKTTITAMVLHVLKKQGIKADYLLGSVLEGYEHMVQLSDDAPLAIFEGDEYLSSTIDKKPKFMHYHPNIALISGIAWDHVNVFKDEKIYARQFRTFIESLPQDGMLIYHEGDKQLTAMVDHTDVKARKAPYATPDYFVSHERTYLRTGAEEIPMQVFGRHNMQNMAGARQICKALGISDKHFYQAIASFKGASSRLSLYKDHPKLKVYRDFAHAPSKVRATVDAVKEQYPAHALIACLELHTFSSLNINFLAQYQGTMQAADEAVVYFDPDAIRQKRLPQLLPDKVKQAFGKNVQVFTSADELQKHLLQAGRKKSTLLMMSSGHFSGMDLDKLTGNMIKQLEG